MTLFSFRTAGLQAGTLCLTLCAGTAWAQALPSATPAAADTAASPGFTLLGDAPDVTHWGLGAGVGAQGSPYRGYGSKVSPIPLLYFDDRWVHLLGTTLDLKVGKWAGVSVGLRAQFDLFDGYKASDAPILNGMQNRNGALWYGPALAWESPLGTLSGDFLLGGNKGEQAKLEFAHTFQLGAFSIKPHLGAQWLSNQYVDYYYGVMPSEARDGRPAYGGKSAWQYSLGTELDYALTRQQRILLDLGVTRLGGGITDSPLVGRRYVPQVRLGYLYQFK